MTAALPRLFALAARLLVVLTVALAGTMPAQARVPAPAPVMAECDHHPVAGTRDPGTAAARAACAASCALHVALLPALPVPAGPAAPPMPVPMAETPPSGLEPESAEPPPRA